MQLANAVFQSLNFSEAERAVDSLLWLKEIYWKFIDLFSRTIFDPAYQLFWLYLVTFLVVAVFSYLLYYKRGAFSPRDFLRFCFPKAIYLHPSAMVDYKIYIVNMVLFPFIRMAPFVGTVVVAAAVGDQLTAIFGVREPLFASGLWSNAIFTIAVLIVADFAFYVSHALHHFIPVLWPFHSVHHSAEVLTPITAFRTHPLYRVVNQTIMGVTSGLFQGWLLYYLFGKMVLVTILGVNFGLALFNLAGSNLRHTHIWLSYGPKLNHILVSPAGHQIHHSAAPEHRDKNLGQVFAIWDWMFGTLVIPGDRKALVFGIGDDRPQPHSSLLLAYAVPFSDVWKAFRRQPRRSKRT